MLNKRVKILTIATAVFFTISGCVDMSDEIFNEDTDAERVQLREYFEPPERVPEVTVNGVAVSPSKYRWRVNDEWDYKTVETVDDELALLNSLQTVSSDGILEYQIFTDVMPLSFHLEQHTEFGANGIPVDTPAFREDCLKSEFCSVTKEDTKVIVKFTATKPGAIVALTIFYGKIIETTEGYDSGMLDVSWVVRILP